MSSKSSTSRERPGSILVSVRDRHTDTPVVSADVSIWQAGGFTCDTFSAAQWQHDRAVLVATRQTEGSGRTEFTGLVPGHYVVTYDHYPVTPAHCVEVHGGCAATACFDLDLDARVTMTFETSDCQPSSCRTARVTDRALAMISFNGDSSSDLRPYVSVAATPPWTALPDDPLVFARRIRQPGAQRFEAALAFDRRFSGGAGPGAMAPGAGGALPAARLGIHAAFEADERTPTPIAGSVGVTMSRTETEPTEDLSLWTLIRNSTEALSFTNYLSFMDTLFCPDNASAPRGFEGDRFTRKQDMFQALRTRRALPFTDADAYRVLKVATEAFVMVNCGFLSEPLAFDPTSDLAYLDRRDIPPGRDLESVFTDEYLEQVNGTSVLPYLAIIRRKLPDVPVLLPHGVAEEEAELCFGIVQKRLASPCMIELIWSYWQEEGMLVQTMNAITQRFQNLRAPLANDPLANMEIDPLRPLNNLIWGYTQDEQHRLTVVRRNYEYDHHYGLRLDGKAVQRFRPADSRSKFLEAFHFLLRLCTTFYRQDDDTTVKADAFPVLNALKEVHLILSQGAHNQFGDLPSTARIEMMMQQWMLARPEFREFLPTRLMVAYPEPWMDRVDAMKKVQGWTDTSVMHFRDLAIFGEQLLLSIRFGAWSTVFEPNQAFNWARFWRPQVQGYIHSYRAATGVDLTVDARDPVAEGTLPALLLRQRLEQQQSAALAR